MAAQLPQKLNWEMAQTKWASLLNPLLVNPLNSISILENIQLKSGMNIVNTLLGRQPQGWIILDKQGPGDIYRTAPYNDLTLTLTSTANIVITLGVF